MDSYNFDKLSLETSTPTKINLKKISNPEYSTPVNVNKWPILEINLSDIPHSSGTIGNNSDSTESNVPSLPSELLGIIGDDWLLDSTDIDSNIANNNKKLSGSVSKQMIHKSPEIHFLRNENTHILADTTTNAPLQHLTVETVEYDAGSYNSSSESNIKSDLINANVVDPRNDHNYSSLPSKFQSPESDAIKISTLKVLHSKISRSKVSKEIISKQYFCPYCSIMVTKFARHLEKYHKDVNQVKKFLKLRLRSKKRAAAIKEIRDEGTHMHNTSKNLNTGKLLTTRRAQPGYNRSADDYTSCRYCKGFYAKQSLRIHLKRCQKNPSKKILDKLCKKKSRATRVDKQ